MGAGVMNAYSSVLATIASTERIHFTNGSFADKSQFSFMVRFFFKAYDGCFLLLESTKADTPYPFPSLQPLNRSAARLFFAA